MKNNRSINDGEDLPRFFLLEGKGGQRLRIYFSFFFFREYLEELYDDIVNNEIKIQKSDPYPRALKRGWVNVSQKRE